MTRPTAPGAARAINRVASLAASTRARAVSRECGVLLAFALLTILMTWPWARHWRDAATDLGDPYTIAYNLWWDYHATFNQPLHIFDAPVFYPYRDTLAFSEHDYGVALLCFPLFAVGLAPLTVHSLATLAAFALSGYGAFRLARTVTGSTGAAWVAGIAFAFVPYRFHRLPHLHYIFAAWLPLALEALVLFARRRSWRRAAWLFVALAMHGLTCVSWLVLSIIPLALSAVLLVTWRRAWRDSALWLRGGLAVAAAALVVLPFLLPYRRVAAEHGFVRGADEVGSYSATVGQWFSATARNRLWDGLGRDVMTDEAALFPGLLPLLLATAALIFLSPLAAREGDARGRTKESRRLLSEDGEQLKTTDEQVAIADEQVAIADGRVEVTDGQVEITDGQVEVIDEQMTVADDQMTAIDGRVIVADGRVTVADEQIRITDGQGELGNGRVREANERVGKSVARSKEDGVLRVAEGGRGRLLAALLLALDAAAVVAVVLALLAATYGNYRVELFGVTLVQASHYGRALVLAALLLMLRWVISRTELFRALRLTGGRAALLRPGAHGETLALGVVWAAIGFFGSLGMNFFFHRLLFEHVELFRSQRVPARWAMIAYVGLSLLAGLGARQLAAFFARRSKRARRALVFAVVCAALLGEQWAAPLDLVRGQAAPDSLTRRLTETGMSGGVAHLPVFGRGGRDFEHVLRAADHGRPLVTASTSFVPPLVARLHELSQRRPVTTEFLDALEAVPVSYLVVAYSQMTLAEFEATRPVLREGVASGRLRFAGRFEDRGLKDLFAVVKTEPRAASAGEFSAPEIKIRLGAQGVVASAAAAAAAIAGLTPELDAAGPVLARFYKAAYGRAPTYAEFARDLPRLTAGVDFTRDDWPGRLEAAAASFASEFVARAEFAQAHGEKTPPRLVAALAAGSGGRVSPARAESIAAALEAGEETRAGALLRVVGDEEFARAERDPSFVMLHYFAFLERDPDAGGYAAWLRALAADGDRQSFTRAFTGSIEYQNKQRGK